MTKTDLKLLERVFEAEVNGALTGAPYVAQIKSKRMAFLAESGLVQEVTITMSGWPPLKITGWALTELGRLTYCTSC